MLDPVTQKNGRGISSIRAVEQGGRRPDESPLTSSCTARVSWVTHDRSRSTHASDVLCVSYRMPIHPHAHVAHNQHLSPPDRVPAQSAEVVPQRCSHAAMQLCKAMQAMQATPSLLASNRVSPVSARISLRPILQTHPDIRPDIRSDTLRQTQAPSSSVQTSNIHTLRFRKTMHIPTRRRAPRAPLRHVLCLDAARRRSTPMNAISY